MPELKPIKRKELIRCWLINRQDKQVEIYRQNQEVEILNNPEKLSGEDILIDFELNLEVIW